MNKQELLDKAVHEFGGKWGGQRTRLVYCDDFGFIYSDNEMLHTNSWHVSEFQQRARELGYINGYRWGVEYPTNGKKPDLADDVFVQMRYPNGEWHPLGSGGLGYFTHSAFSSFRITDQRYKPADTSYLDNESVITYNYNDGAEHFEWIANQFKNADDINAVWQLRDKLYHNRKAEAEKKRVVDAAAKKFHTSIMHDYSGQPFLDGLSALYDAGYLKLPAE